MAKAAKCDDGKPRRKPKPKPKLSDEARHKRFVEMAREVEADDRSEAFDRAFSIVVGAQNKKSRG